MTELSLYFNINIISLTSELPRINVHLFLFEYILDRYLFEKKKETKLSPFHLHWNKNFRNCTLDAGDVLLYI